MDISKKIEALEEKFEQDNDEHAFVDGIIEIVSDPDFVPTILSTGIHCDSMVFAWTDDDELDMTADPFGYGDVSDENTKAVNDAIHEAYAEYIESEEIAYDMIKNPYAWTGI